jgi:hypothetical protein
LIQEQAVKLEKFVLGLADQRAFITEVRAAKDQRDRDTLALAALDLSSLPKTLDLAVQAAEILISGPESLEVFNAAIEVYLAADLNEKAKEAAQRGVRFMSANRKPGDEDLFEMFRAVAKG